MTNERKSKVAGALGDFSILLASFSAMTYELGAVADVFPPEVKKWIAISALVAAAVSKGVQRTIEIVSK